MNNNINDKIIEKINEISDKNIKDFIIEALEIEYEFRDYDKPRNKEKYNNLIEKYCRD